MNRLSKIRAYSKAFFNHENYHGWFRKKKYFEGWYFKVVDRSEQHAYAFIPGVAMDAAGNRQSFIQVLDGKNVTAAFHKFPFAEFHAARQEFKIQVAENSFSLEKMVLNLPGITGRLNFTNHFEWPKKVYSPGIMGYYSFVPFMECYHQVVSMNFTTNGSLFIRNEAIDFDGGRGYIEKDWGRSFPSSWIWMQSNHFDEPGISFKLSVAKIPWLTGAFTGFICAFLLKGKLIRFATYNGARLKKIEVGDGSVSISIHGRNHVLNVTATQTRGAELATPVHGFMEGRVKESMDGRLRVEMIDVHSGKAVFMGEGRNAGLEVAGNTSELRVD